MQLDDIINFADTTRKREFIHSCGVLDRPHKVTIEPYTARRRGQANRYWFGVIVKAFCNYQKEQGSAWSKDRAHEFIVGEVLGLEEVINPKTGKVSCTRRETKNMSVEAFSEMIELGHAWLADWGIEVESYDQFKQMEQAAA